MNSRVCTEVLCCCISQQRDDHSHSRFFALKLVLLRRIPSSQSTGSSRRLHRRFESTLFFATSDASERPRGLFYFLFFCCCVKPCHCHPSHHLIWNRRRGHIRQCSRRPRNHTHFEQLCRRCFFHTGFHLQNHPLTPSIPLPMTRIRCVSRCRLRQPPPFRSQDILT